MTQSQSVIAWGEQQLLDTYNAIKNLQHYSARYHSNRASREENHAFFGILHNLLTLLNYTARVGPLQKCHAKDPKSRFRSLEASGIQNEQLARQWQVVRGLTLQDPGFKDQNMLDLVHTLMNSDKVPALVISFFGPEGSRDFNVGEHRFLLKKLIIPLYNETLRWWRLYRSLL